ncbi:MAG: hypothetical protein FWD36_04665 [Treponema sp.]|nr:hypothetical protein [Treponema sp.]
MKQIFTFYDSRHDNYCSYCGNRPDTRDHVPSKILLDKPFPENLPVVPCCLECNNKFSVDEEYVSCIFECIIKNICEIKNIKNIRIRNIFERKITLYKKVKELFSNNDIQQILYQEKERINNVLVKLSKGHYKYEFGEPMFNSPDIINTNILKYMKDDDLNKYFSFIKENIFPEIWSRSFINFYQKELFWWIEVQENVYLYLVYRDGDKSIVKIIIMDYFAFEIIWIN